MNILASKSDRVPEYEIYKSVLSARQEEDDGFTWTVKKGAPQKPLSPNQRKAPTQSNKTDEAQKLSVTRNDKLW